MALRKYAFNKSKEIAKFTDDFSNRVDEAIAGKKSQTDYSKVDDHIVTAAVSKEDYSKAITLKVGKFIAKPFTRNVVYSNIAQKQEPIIKTGLDAQGLADRVEKNLSRYERNGSKIEFYDPNEVSAVVIEPTPKEEVKVEPGKAEPKKEETLEYITFEQILKLRGIASHSTLTNQIIPKIRKEHPEYYVDEYVSGSLVQNVKYVAVQELFNLLYEDATNAKEVFKDWKSIVKNTQESALNSLISRIKSKDEIALTIEEITKLPGVKKYWDIRKNILPKYSEKNPDAKVKVDNNPASGFKYKLTADLAEEIFDDKTVCAKIVDALGKETGKVEESIDDKFEPSGELWVTKLEMQSFDGARKGSLEKVFAQAHQKGEIEARQRISDRSSNGGSVQIEYKFTKELVSLAFKDEEKGKELYDRFKRGEKIINPTQKKDITELLKFIAEGKMLTRDEISSYEGLLRISTIEKKLREAASVGKVEEDRTLSDAKQGPTKFKINYDFLNGLVDDLRVTTKIQEYFSKNEAPPINLDLITDQQLADAKPEEMKTTAMRYPNVLILTLEDERKLLFKPTIKQEVYQVVSGGRLTGDTIPPEHQTLNEVVVSLIDEAFGFGLVEKTVIRKVKGEIGALRAYIPDFKMAEDIDFDKEVGPDFDKQNNCRKALKFIANDCEGHLKNWGIRKISKKVAVMDQALTMDEETKCAVGEVKKDKDLLDKLEATDTKLLASKLEAVNVNGISLSEEQIFAALDRIDILKRHLTNLLSA